MLLILVFLVVPLGWRVGVSLSVSCVGGRRGSLLGMSIRGGRRLLITSILIVGWVIIIVVPLITVQVFILCVLRWWSPIVGDVGAFVWAIFYNSLPKYSVLGIFFQPFILLSSWRFGKSTLRFLVFACQVFFCGLPLSRFVFNVHVKASLAILCVLEQMIFLTNLSCRLQIIWEIVLML